VEHLGHQQAQGGGAAAAVLAGGRFGVDQRHLMALPLQMPGGAAANDAAADDGQLAQDQACLRSS
jgi:hypothetical protein